MIDSAGRVTLTSSAISELVQALSVLPDHDALTTALAAASHLSSQQPVLYAALTRIRHQHGYFTAAWNALGRTDTFSQLSGLAEPPAEAAALAAIVRDAEVAWSSYRASGEFSPWRRARLTTSPLQWGALVASSIPFERTSRAHERATSTTVWPWSIVYWTRAAAKAWRRARSIESPRSVIKTSI